MKQRLNKSLLISILLGSLAACTNHPSANTQPLQTIGSLDVHRYLGRWYEIAKYPNWFQRNCVGETSADYSLNPDGTIEVFNQCRLENGNMNTAQGEAQQISGTTSPKLEVRFAPAWLSWMPIVWGDYWVIDLDKNYSLAAVSEPQRDYLWILSRTPKINAKDYNSLVQRLKDQGFDMSKLEITLQK